MNPLMLMVGVFPLDIRKGAKQFVKAVGEKFSKAKDVPVSSLTLSLHFWGISNIFVP